MTINELANWQVCPNTGNPQTVYELNMVKMFIAFGMKVKAELEKQGGTQMGLKNGPFLEAKNDSSC